MEHSVWRRIIVMPYVSIKTICLGSTFDTLPWNKCYLVLSLVNKPFLSVNKNKTENKQSIKLSDKLKLVSYTLINVRKYLKSLNLIN